MGTAVDNRIQLVEHDTANALLVTYEGVDLTGYEIELHIAYPGCPLVVPAQITDAPAGEFRFTFAWDALVRGSYEGAILLRDPVGNEQTVKGFVFDILRRLKG